MKILVILPIIFISQLSLAESFDNTPDDEGLTKCTQDYQNARYELSSATDNLSQAKQMLSTSLIGPGKRADNFEKSYNLCKKIKLDKQNDDALTKEIKMVFKGDLSGAAQCYHALRDKNDFCVPDQNLNKIFGGDGGQNTTTANGKYDHCRTDFDKFVKAKINLADAQDNLRNVRKECKDLKVEILKEQNRTPLMTNPGAITH